MHPTDKRKRARTEDSSYDELDSNLSEDDSLATWPDPPNVVAQRQEMEIHQLRNQVHEIQLSLDALLNIHASGEKNKSFPLGKTARREVSVSQSFMIVRLLDAYRLHPEEEREHIRNLLNEMAMS